MWKNHLNDIKLFVYTSDILNPFWRIYKIHLSEFVLIAVFHKLRLKRK